MGGGIQSAVGEIMLQNLDGDSVRLSTGFVRNYSLGVIRIHHGVPLSAAY